MPYLAQQLFQFKNFVINFQEYNNPDVIHDGFGQINEQINYENDPVAINDPDPAAAAPLATAPAVAAPAVAAPAATAPAAATPAAAPAAAAPGAAGAPAAAWYPKTVY